MAPTHDSKPTLNLKKQQSPVIWDLCLRQTRAGNSLDYREAIVFKKIVFEMFFRTHFLQFEERFPKATFS